MHILSIFFFIVAATPGKALPSLGRDRDGDDKTSPSHSPSEAEASPTGPALLIIDGNPHTKTPSSCNYAWPTLLAPIASVQACQDYLGGPDAASDCSIPPPPVGEDPNAPAPTFGSRVLCQQTDNTVVMGATFNNSGTSSACRDVATGVQWVLGACAIEGQVAGQAPAYGNGDLIVVVQQGMYLNLTEGEGRFG